MKNTVKFPGIIALVAVIVFSFVSCDDNIGGGTGDNLQVSMPVTYSNDYVTNITEARAVKDFSYVIGSYDSSVDVYTAIPLSTHITGSPRVEMTGGTVNIQLGKPKEYWLSSPNTTGLKTFAYPYPFCTYDAKYILVCMKNTISGSLYPAYADRDGTMEVWDSDIDGNPIGKPYYIPIKRGWQWAKWRMPGEDPKDTIFTTIPSGYKWVVIETSIWMSW
jgi:hypothetical protein